MGRHTAGLLIVLTAMLFCGHILFANAEVNSISVTVSIFECGDGADNDSDGLFDFPSDDGCASARDDDESENKNKEVHTFSASSAFTVDLVNTNNTSLSLDIPTSVTSAATLVKTTLISQPKSEVVGSHPIPSGKEAAGTFYDVSFVDAGDASSTIATLDKNVTLTFAYTADDISGIDEGTLAVYHWNGAQWEKISGSGVDTDANTVTAATNDFSPIALFSILGDAETEESGSDSSDTEESSSSGGGGGGGGAYIPAPTATISFSGTAYPNADLVLLEDAVRVATGTAGTAGDFSITYTKARTGVHTYSISAYDVRGVGPAIETVSVDVSQGVATFVNGILLPPTLFAEKTQVRAGDTATFSGYSVPEANVRVSVTGDVTKTLTVTADDTGAWRVVLETGNMPQGQYKAVAYAIVDGVETARSSVRNFRVGTQNISAEEPAQQFLTADINKDGKVDLVDFSIVAYWYDKSQPPQRVDLHANGVIDLRDFGVLAYYWTG